MSDTELSAGRKISVVVAVYQNEGSLTETHAQISALFDGPLAGDEMELVFVNDGSTDGSLEELHSIRNKDPRV